LDITWRSLAIAAGTALALGAAAPTTPRSDQALATTAPVMLERIEARLPAKAFSGPDKELSALEIIARDTYEQEKGFRFPKLVRGRRDRPWVALTFDDGPHPDFTPRILGILKRERVPATFFVVGKQAQAFPDLVRREVAEGHEIGNHTYHHVRLTWIDPRFILPEIEAANVLIQEITGSPTRWFRPPGGDYDRDVITTLRQANMIMALWTDDPGDWSSPGATKIERRTLDRIGNGAVILIHDGITQTLDILPDLIHKVRARGFEFVSLNQLAASLPE
jgi:peptidoglycan/xylan/chitin deacetylase (PgdA/CDA1 family)